MVAGVARVSGAALRPAELRRFAGGCSPQLVQRGKGGVMFEEMVGRPAPVPEVVPGSTPVIAFGDPLTATVATLGINPSWREFPYRRRVPAVRTEAAPCDPRITSCGKHGIASTGSDAQCYRRMRGVLPAWPQSLPPLVRSARRNHAGGARRKFLRSHCVPPRPRTMGNATRVG